MLVLGSSPSQHAQHAQHGQHRHEHQAAYKLFLVQELCESCLSGALRQRMLHNPQTGFVEVVSRARCFLRHSPWPLCSLRSGDAARGARGRRSDGWLSPWWILRGAQEAVLGLLLDIASGLQYMHERNIIHGGAPSPSA